MIFIIRCTVQLTEVGTMNVFVSWIDDNGGTCNAFFFFFAIKFL